VHQPFPPVLDAHDVPPAFFSAANDASNDSVQTGAIATCSKHSDNAQWKLLDDLVDGMAPMNLRMRLICAVLVP